MRTVCLDDMLGSLLVKMADLMFFIFHADERTKVFHEVSDILGHLKREGFQKTYNGKCLKF